MYNYRTKIYKYYSSNRIGKLAPGTVVDFQSRAPYLKKLIKDHFPANKKALILEVGCGHGTLLYYLVQAGYENVSGIDTSEEQVLAAQRLGIRNVIKADIAKHLSDWKDNTLDVIVAFDVIEHFTKDEISNLLDEFYRVLIKGGKLITHQPNSDGPFSNAIRYGDFTHENAFSFQSIAQILLSSGFNLIQSFEDKPIIHGVKSLIRYILWEYLVRRIYVIINIIESGSCDKNAIFTKNFLTVAEK